MNARVDHYIEGLRGSENPCVVYRARLRLDDESADTQDQQARRRRIAESLEVRRLLSRRGSDGTIKLGSERHAYRKFQGAHWTLAGLAELGYPAGDASLLPLVDQVHAWLCSREHLRPPSTQVIAGHEDRVRRCASQEGLAIWYLHELGLVDERVDTLVARLVDFQWPDGGWNCDKDPTAMTSSVQETLLPMRGLARHLRAGAADPRIASTVDAAADFLLQRRLLWRRRDGAPIEPTWGPDPRSILWPIRLYDVLSALVAMAEIDRVTDPRCADALGILADKRLPGGGFPAETRTARTVDVVASQGTFADWGPSGRSRPNPYVSLDAAWVLRTASKAPVQGFTAGVRSTSGRDPRLVEASARHRRVSPAPVPDPGPSGTMPP